MSVATEGIKGYEYQYKVTVLFGLIYGNKINSKLYVEKIGSEDVTFIDENQNCIEIQIKREKSSIEFPKIIDWLSHFQERKSDNNLLLRIKSKKSKCIFVTRSRCSDETTIFLKEFPSIDSNTNKPSDAIILKFKDTLNDLKFKKTKLNIQREAFCKNISKELNELETEILINNTLIWEQIEEDKVDNEVLNYLNKKYFIPQSITETLYLKLLEIVKKGRDSQEDIIPVFNDLILKFKVNRYNITENHITRKEEIDSLKILNNSNLLLLTGISQCGKTELAKKIANDFIDKGYNSISVSSEFFQIENFFNQNKGEDKILIFEDPFGHIKPKSESNDIKNKIISISKSLPLNHKLIVTSKIEILDEAFATDKIVENIINLTEDDNKLILDFWIKFSNKQNIDIEVINIVSEYIKNETQHKIQVGQLDYLSRYDSDKLKSKSLAELISIARHNSKDISDDLLKENYEYSKILGILSTCCDNNTGIYINDLGYVLSEDDTQYSVFRQTKIIQFLKKKTKYPKYAKVNKIKKNFKQNIEYFEERGFIKYDNDKLFFSHPNYFEVGRNLFFRKSYDEQKKNIKYFEKSIVCVNPKTALFCCKQLTLIYNRIDVRFKESIKDLMFLANQSIFPSVEDYSSINLINVIGDINNEKEKSKIIGIINRGNTDTGSIDWYNQEIPFIGKESNIRDYFVNNISEENVEVIKIKLLNNESVKLFDVWSFVNCYRLLASRKLYYKLNKDLINSLLTYEEVFIRKQVAKIFFLSQIDKNEVYLIEKILNDIHPTVVFYGIWGSFLSWNKQSDEVKTIVFELLKKLLCRQEIAIRANNLLTTFSVDYSGECIDWKIFSREETIELWNVWGQIFPIFSNSLPPNISLNYGRFGNTMKTSMKYLTVENGIKVFNTWLSRIELKIQNEIEFSDYEMGISDDLIEFTKENVEIRKNLIERILSNENSIFCLYNLKIMTSYWEELDSTERELILRLINSNRIDQRWIKAVLLTKYEVPKEIELKIVGDVNLFSLKPKKVIEILSEELIYDCLKIIYAKPYELEYLRSSYLSDFWKRMINYILFYQIEPFFDICIQDFIQSNIFGNRSDNFLLWRKICLNSQNINYLTYLVVYNISKGAINVNGTMRIIKNLIFAYQERNEYEVFIKIIADEIEVLQQTSDKNDIFYIFDKDLIFNDLYKNIFPDLAAKIIIEKAGIEFLETFIDGIEFETFRFFYSYHIIKKLVNKNDKMDEETKNKLLSIPNKIDEVGEIKQKELKVKYFKEEKIENWIK